MNSSPTHTTKGKGEIALHNLLVDTLAFVTFTFTDEKLSDDEKLGRIVATLGHDIVGTVTEKRCFRPRVSGYARMMEMGAMLAPNHSHA